jgi:hypothetical protein
MVTCGMQYFPPNKIWLIVLSTPLFSSSLYAAASEPVASLAPIVVQAEDGRMLRKTVKNIKRVSLLKQPK